MKDKLWKRELGRVSMAVKPTDSGDCATPTHETVMVFRCYSFKCGGKKHDAVKGTFVIKENVRKGQKTCPACKEAGTWAYTSKRL